MKIQTQCILLLSLSSTECPIVGAVRLAGGTERKGLLEICYNHTWGLVCDDEWNYTEALVVCKALRFPNASENSCIFYYIDIFISLSIISRLT